MNSEELCEQIERSTPNAKDLKRANDIIENAVEHVVYEPGWGNRRIYLEDARSILANKQLKAIKDTEKFFRRCKAFLNRGITIKFNNTIFSNCADLTVKDYIKSSVQMAKHDEEVERVLAKLDSVNL